MIDKLLNLKNTNKILYYILLPLVGLAFIVGGLMKLNVIGAKKDLKKAEKETEALEKERDELLDKADDVLKESSNHKSKAEVYEEQANELKESAEKAEADDSADYDWHLKD